MTPKQKGKDLEEAVLWIEQMIERKAAASGHPHRTIEVNKRVTENEVDHEIDVWVEEHREYEPNAIYIFECKNVKRPVEKKIIPDFQRKIQDVGAAHGFFIAHKFTRSAQNLAKQDKHLTLLQLDTEPTALLKVISPHFYELRLDGTIRLEVHFRDGGENRVKSHRASNYGKEIDLSDYMNELAFQEAYRISESDRRFRILDGSHRQAYDVSFATNPRELVVDGRDVAHFRIFGSFHVQNDKLEVQRFYDVETRGYVSRFGGVYVDQQELTLEIVGKIPKPTPQH